jgi:ribosomal 30S subunit maturation factor RimM
VHDLIDMKYLEERIGVVSDVIKSKANDVLMISTDEKKKF